MAVNAVPFAANTGQLMLPANERLLIEGKAELRLTSNGKDLFHSPSGTVYATTSRVIYKPAKLTAEFTSLLIPVYFCSKPTLQQPLFGANYFQCEVAPFEGARMTSNATLRLTFPSGGAYEFYVLFNKVHDAISKAAAAAGPPPELLPSFEEAVRQPAGPPDGFVQNGPAFPLQTGTPLYTASSNFPQTSDVGAPPPY